MFSDLKRKFDGEIVSEEEFDEIDNSDYVESIELNRIADQYYKIYSYTAIANDSDDYFDFYFTEERSF